MKYRYLAVILAAVLLATALGYTALAGHGPETIIGTRHAEVLRGGTGPDTIRGRGGADRIWGNRAPDRIFGGRGADVLHGFGSGETHDLLVGGPGRDTCIGTRRDTFRSCEVKIVRKGLGPR